MPRQTGGWKEAVITVASDDDLTPEVDLGGEYEQLLIEIPTITSAQVSLQVARSSGGTFRDLHMVLDADGTTGQIITDAGTGGIMVIMPLGGFRYIKVKTSAGQAADRTFYVQGVHNLFR